MSRGLFVFFASALLSLPACTGKGAASGADAKASADADPLALVPGAALAVASVDAHAMYASGSIGATVSSYTDALVPLNDATAGFQASRDVDRVVLAAYASTDADVAVVLTGRFDVDKIAAATATKTGAPIVRGAYLGFATDTAGAVTIAPLTAKTLVAGTTERVHRVLDRLGPSAPKLERALPPWVTDTLATPGAQFAVAADFATQPVASATLGSINLTWLKDLREARAIGDFDPPGINVAATLTYGDATEAQGAVDGMRVLDGLQKVLAPLLLGAKLSNLQVDSTGPDVSCKFAVDDSSLQALLTLASRYLRPPTP
jgi:hypothetical protein